MEFEGSALDKRRISGLVRSVSGNFDRLISTASDETRHRLASSEEEVEVLECRVCRGEPEAGRRLFAPCLCSGSIMYTHEDCLLQWLQHSGKDVCELCGHRFAFTPVYAPDAPETLAAWQVLLTCSRKTLLEWLPFLLRVLLAAVLWLMVVPLATSWLYRIWIHRTRVLLPQLFLQRLTPACLWSDCVSGLIIAAAIILSFLSLMTFADFLADQLLRDDWEEAGDMLDDEEVGDDGEPRRPQMPAVAPPAAVVPAAAAGLPPAAAEILAAAAPEEPPQDRLEVLLAAMEAAVAEAMPAAAAAAAAAADAPRLIGEGAVAAAVEPAGDSAGLATSGALDDSFGEAGFAASEASVAAKPRGVAAQARPGAPPAILTFWDRSGRAVSDIGHRAGSGAGGGGGGSGDGDDSRRMERSLSTGPSPRTAQRLRVHWSPQTSEAAVAAAPAAAAAAANAGPAPAASASATARQGAVSSKEAAAAAEEAAAGDQEPSLALQLQELLELAPPLPEDTETILPAMTSGEAVPGGATSAAAAAEGAVGGSSSSDGENSPLPLGLAVSSDLSLDGSSSGGGSGGWFVGAGAGSFDEDTESKYSFSGRGSPVVPSRKRLPPMGAAASDAGPCSRTVSDAGLAGDSAGMAPLSPGERPGRLRATAQLHNSQVDLAAAGVAEPPPPPQRAAAAAGAAAADRDGAPPVTPRQQQVAAAVAAEAPVAAAAAAPDPAAAADVAATAAEGRDAGAAATAAAAELGDGLAQQPQQQQQQQRRRRRVEREAAGADPVPEVAEEAAAGGAGGGGGGGGAAAPAAAAAAAAAPAEEEDDDGDNMDMEAHVALDELLGVRGPLPTLLRNVLWLLAFNGAYLGLFAFIPYSVGSSSLAIVAKRLVAPGAASAAAAGWTSGGAGPIVKAARALRRASADGDHTLQLPDLATICLGYMIMSAMVFGWRTIIYGVCDRSDLPVLRRVRRAMRVTAAVVKVGVLLSLKMLLLPLVLGVCLDAVTLPLFSAAPADRIGFMTRNLVGSLLLHWVLGITFMLFVTVSVLQLREVMHPDILAHVIRPQEPHPDLLGSLLQESGKTHARRMAMSLAIYVALLFLFVWAPVRAALVLVPDALLVAPRLCYLVPQLQIPLELIVFHLGMLAFLERFKNRIGEMQHAWLVFVCARLGLTRFLLPLPVIARVRVGPPSPTEGDGDDNAVAPAAAAAVAGGNGDNGDNGAAGNGGDGNVGDQNGAVNGNDGAGDGGGVGNVAPGGMARAGEGFPADNAPAGAAGDAAGNAAAAAAAAGAAATGTAAAASVSGGFGRGGASGLDGSDESDGIVVGRPLRRPPLGWDDPAGVAQGRWAWAGEPLGPVQRNLAPRRRPCGGGGVGGRLAILLLLAWISVLASSLTVLLAPFLLGRRAFALLHVPLRWNHDPFAFAAGAALCRTVCVVAASAAAAIRPYLSPGWTARRRAPPAAAAATAALFVGLWFVLSPLLIGVLFEAMFVVTSEQWRDHLMSAFSPLQEWLLGTGLLHLWAYLCYLGLLDGLWPPRMRAAGAPARHNRWQARIREALRIWQQALLLWEWEEVRPRPLILEGAGVVAGRLAVCTLVPLTVSVAMSMMRSDIDLFDGLIGKTAANISELPPHAFQLLVFRSALLAYAVVLMGQCISEPAMAWLRMLHDSVRDDRYLLGLQLQNHPQAVPKMHKHAQVDVDSDAEVAGSGHGSESGGAGGDGGGSGDGTGGGSGGGDGDGDSTAGSGGGAGGSVSGSGGDDSSSGVNGGAGGGSDGGDSGSGGGGESVAENVVAAEAAVGARAAARQQAALL